MAKPAQRSRLLIVALLAVAVAGAVVLVAGKTTVLGWWRQGMEWLQFCPVWVFAVLLCLGPLVALPVAPIFVALGARVTTGPAVALALGSIVVSLSLTYALSGHVLKDAVTRLLTRRGYTVPRFSGEDELLATLLLRLTPGIPVFVGNYLLPLAGVRLVVYLTVSFVIQSAYAVGFVVVGRSFLSGRLGFVVSALLAVIAIGVSARFVFRRLKLRAAKPGSTLPEA